MELSKENEKLLWSLFWAFVLIMLSLVVASFAAQVYIFASILSVFVNGLDSFLELCLTGINFPSLCARNMRSGQSLNEAVDQMDSYQAYSSPVPVPVPVSGPVLQPANRVNGIESSQETIRVLPTEPVRQYVPEV